MISLEVNILLMSHQLVSQSLEAVKRICPKRALLIGMTHEFDHHKDNDFLMEWTKRYKLTVSFLVVNHNLMV